MPKETQYDCGKTIIKHRGFYDNTKVIRAIFNWYKHNDFYFDVEKYKLTGITLKYTFKGYKKVTEYLKWHMKCFLIIYQLEDVEVIKEGKKIKTNHGKFHAEITGILEVDWQERYKGGKFVTFLGDFLRKYVLKYKIVDMWEDEVALKIDELAAVIKEALGQEVV